VGSRGGRGIVDGHAHGSTGRRLECGLRRRGRPRLYPPTRFSASPPGS